MASRPARTLPLRPMLALLLAAGLLLVGGPGTWAWWSDDASVSGTRVTSGTLDLVVGKDVDDAVTWSGLSLEDMAPGESVAAELTVANAGSVPFTWTVDGSATGALSPQVSATVVVGGTASTTSATYPRAGSCTGGTTSYTGTLGGTSTRVVATQAALAGGASTTLCVRLRLPDSAPNGAQGHVMTPSFTVAASQAAP